MSTALEIRTFLWAKGTPWSPEQTKQLVEDLAGFLVSRGFSNVDEDIPVRSIITAKNVDAPEDAREFSDRFIDKDTEVILLPTDQQEPS